MGNRIRSLRLDDEVFEAIENLEGNSINEKLRGLLNQQKPALDPRIDKLLELAQSLPDAIEVRGIVEEVMQQKIDERAASRVNPVSIPGVQVGAQGLQLDAKYLRSDGSKMSYAERRRAPADRYQGTERRDRGYRYRSCSCRSNGH